MDDVVKLLKVTKTKDEYGIDRETYVSKEVYCRTRSVTQTEFFDAGRNGLNPEYQITVFHADYDGEVLVEYNGKTYAVYRTYRREGDYIELYVERKGGANGTVSGN